MLIQIGGLGFMTVGATASFIIGRTISLKERIIMSEALNQDSLSGIVRMTRHIIFGTIALEALGAVLLSFAFVPQFGFWDGVAKGIFHSVSAFCNAGFDLMGEVQPFSSLTDYVGNPLVNITIMGLVVIGGLGFYVWEDVLNRKKLKKFSLHTKVTFIMTAILLVGGAVLFYAFEHNNPNTMGALSGGEKAWASMFMSVTPRTAGYNTIDIAALSPVASFHIHFML